MTHRPTFGGNRERKARARARARIVLIIIGGMIDADLAVAIVKQEMLVLLPTWLLQHLLYHPDMRKWCESAARSWTTSFSAFTQMWKLAFTAIAFPRLQLTSLKSTRS